MFGWRHTPGALPPWYFACTAAPAPTTVRVPIAPPRWAAAPRGGRGPCGAAPRPTLKRFERPLSCGLVPRPRAASCACAFCCFLELRFCALLISTILSPNENILWFAASSATCPPIANASQAPQAHRLPGHRMLADGAARVCRLRASADSYLDGIEGDESKPS